MYCRRQKQWQPIADDFFKLFKHKNFGGSVEKRCVPSHKNPCNGTTYELRLIYGGCSLYQPCYQ